MFNVACELSQPKGKTEFSSTARKKNKFYLIGKKKNSPYNNFMLHRMSAVPNRPAVSHIVNNPGEQESTQPLDVHYTVNESIKIEQSKLC